MKHPRIIVKLHMMRGKATYDESGNITSESQTHKLQYNSIKEWPNFVKNIKTAGFTKIELLSVIDMNGILSESELKEKEEEIKAAIRAIFEKKPEDMTPEQKEIAELRAMLTELTGGKKKEKKAEKPAEPEEPKEAESSETEEESDEQPDSLEAARALYKEKFGKKPHYSWDAEKLMDKINNAE